jgi:hypothetical protein
VTTTAVAPAVRPSVGSQVVYYAGWVLMLLVESALWSVLGVVAGLVGFTAGGLGWAWWQYDQTAQGERLRGPVLRLTQRLLGWGVLGFVGAVLVGGPPGVAAAAASTGYRDGRRLVVESSLLYALVWATFHVARPDAGMPIGLAPAWF